MKYLVELEMEDDGVKTQPEWALWILKCICSYLNPDGVKSISVIAAEPDEGVVVQ